MPLIQFDCPEELDVKLKHFMIDKKIVDKRQAVIDILKKYFSQ